MPFAVSVLASVLPRLKYEAGCATFAWPISTVIQELAGMSHQLHRQLSVLEIAVALKGQTEHLGST
jgi:hypothetical protein